MSADRLALIEADLRASLDDFDSPPNLREAIAYALLGGGKRLRPILTLESAVAAAGVDADRSAVETRALLPARAVEYVHAFSLVHDDLPAMDDDDLRRGRPTLHIHTNEAMAILAGDAMSVLAFDFLRRDPGGLAATLSAELTEASMRMIAGQVLDTLGGFDDAEAPVDRLRRIHRHKTGALIRAACRMGALVGLDATRPMTTIDPKEASARLEAISDFADAQGLIFQLVDDLLDVEQSSEHTGKRTGKDEAAGKLTYPGTLGLSDARAERDRLVAEAAEALHRLHDAGGDPRGLETLSHVLAKRTR